jgi:hypothetical protein
MNESNMINAELAELVSVFRETARSRGACLQSGDYRRGNKAAALLKTIYAELRRRGADSQSALLPLLEDGDPGVRLEAATRVWDFASDKAAPVLEVLA